MWTHRHLLGIEELSTEDVEQLLDSAEGALARMRSGESMKDSALRGRTVINLFFESSTRTRTSFELAGKRLGADVVNVSPAQSSLTKGETLLDTIRNIEAMHAEVIVIRHAASGAPHFVAARTRASIVNAGDGAHEHPTQALLDALTMKTHGKKLMGLKVAIVGDILHSRVVRSNVLLLGKLGANVCLCGPKTMVPLHPEALGPTVSFARRIEQAIDGADVVMMLRIQNERGGGAPMLASNREYSRTYGLSLRLLERAKPDAIVMHPGPINRGVELDAPLADGPRSVILDQVEAGVAVRIAVLEAVASARGDQVAARADSPAPPGRS
jgi:aspartate carbamoyltransferase catalytic subunit